jgi:hypothetical protein
MTIGAIITARSTSSRYPRKHLGQLGDRTMIEQIILKLKKLQGLDCIILSTTINATDNELCNVAWEAGAIVNRGPEHNLLERDLMAIHDFKLDAVLSISGDCPFVSNECAQILIDGLRAETHPENYDTVGGFASLTSAWGFVPSIQMKSWFYKHETLMEEHSGYSYEQYWLSRKEDPDLFKALEIDTSVMLPVEVTPMKMSIDWNLERLFWCKVIDWLGYYPERIEDFNRAFGGMLIL